MINLQHWESTGQLAVCVGLSPCGQSLMKLALISLACNGRFWEDGLE